MGEGEGGVGEGACCLLHTTLFSGASTKPMILFEATMRACIAPLPAIYVKKFVQVSTKVRGTYKGGGEVNMCKYKYIYIYIHTLTLPSVVAFLCERFKELLHCTHWLIASSPMYS